jgi:hypothetical protein
MIMMTFKKLLTIAMLLTLVSPIFAESNDDSPVDNKSTYHITDSIDLITANDVQYEKPKVVIKLVYPKFSNSNDSHIIAENTDTPTNTPSEPAGSSSIIIDAFNQAVTKVIHEEITAFKQQVADAQTYQHTLDKAKVKNRLSVDYSSAIINLEEKPLISIRFIIQGYATGMAHPYRRYRVVNFDIDAGSDIQLSELFKPDSNYMEVITNSAKNDLDKMLRAKSIISSPTAENMTNWNLNLNGIRITFDPATVAPAVYGTQTVLIPYSTLKDPASSLGQCLKHRSRCMRDHLLTGGFIDEAANTRHGALNPVFG